MAVNFLSGLARCRVGAALGSTEHQTWEAATLLALHGRLRSGDIWVEGSRQWRALWTSRSSAQHGGEAEGLSDGDRLDAAEPLISAED